MGLLGDMAMGILNAAVDSMGEQSNVHIKQGDQTTINKLLDKFDDLLQRENLIVDPKITTKKDTVGLSDEKQTIPTFETENSKLTFFFGNARAMVGGGTYSLNESLRPFKHCEFDYVADKEKGKPSFFFMFLISGHSSGELHISFESNAGKIEGELELRLANVSSSAPPSTFSDSNIGLHKLLKKIGREEIYQHLTEFAEHPYSLTEAERERREAEERKRQEAARLENEKRDAEARRRKEEKERKEREEREREEQRQAKLMDSLDDL